MTFERIRNLKKFGIQATVIHITRYSTHNIKRSAIAISLKSHDQWISHIPFHD